MTDEELDRLVVALATSEIAPDDVPWDTFSETERDNILALTRYEIHRRAAIHERAQRRQGAAQVRAMTLLRSLLSAEQRYHLGKRGEVKVTGSVGGIYRLWPETGVAERLNRHGSRLYGDVRYCLHDSGEADERMPPADVTVGHLLMLMADEAAFLAAANATPCKHAQWDGEWKRRLNAARRLAREAA